MKFNKVFAAGLATGVALTTLTTKLLHAIPSSVSTGATQDTEIVSNLALVSASLFPGLDSQSEKLRIPDQADDATNISASLNSLPSIFHQPECSASQTTIAVKTDRGLVRAAVRLGCFLPTLWVEFISEAGLVFPVISLLSIWLMVHCSASRNAAVTVLVYSIVYCMVIANIRFDDEQFPSAILHLAFFLWLFYVLVRIIACRPMTVLYFNGQLALEGRRPLVNIRFGYLLTNGQAHLVRRQRVVDKKLRVRAYARLGREQQARLRMAGKRQRALLLERFGLEQEARATARIAEEKSRKRVLDQLQSTLLKERKISFWQQWRDVESIRRDILRLSPYGGLRPQTEATKADAIGQYEPPRPDDINGAQSDTDDNNFGDDEDSSDDDDDSHRPHGTPVRLRYGKIRPTKTVTRVPASSFRQPAVRWKLPPCFPVTEAVGAPVSSGSTTPASSSAQPSGQQETPASSPPSPTPAPSGEKETAASSPPNPTPASSVSSPPGPTPISSASKATAVKPVKPKRSKKSTPGPSNNGTSSASTSEKIPLVITAPIEKAAASPAEKSIEKASEEGSVVGDKEGSVVGAEGTSPVKETEPGLGFLQGYVSKPWVVGQWPVPEVDDYEAPPEWLPDGDQAEPDNSGLPSEWQYDDKAELDDSELPWEWQPDNGNAEMAPSEISAGSQSDCGYETDGDVLMDNGLPRGRSVHVGSNHEAESDVDMDSECSEDGDVDMDLELPGVPNLPQAPHATDNSMDMDTRPAQNLSEDMEVDADEGWDTLVEAMQGWTITPAPSTSVPPADPSPLPLTSAPRPPQIPIVSRPNDAGHHPQTPHASSSAPTSAAAASSASPSASSSFASSSSAASSSAASSSRLSTASSPPSSFDFPELRPERPREMCQQPNPARIFDSTYEDPESPFDPEDEEREMCSASHPAAELCQNPRCPHFSLQTPHWYVEPNMMAGLLASMEPELEEALIASMESAGPPPVQAPTLVLRPSPSTQPDLSMLDRPLSAADLPAQCNSPSCRHNRTPHWHLGGWVVPNEEQALDLLKQSNKGKGKQRCERPSKTEKDEPSDEDDKGKGKETSAPPSEPAKDDATREDDKGKGPEDVDMGEEKPAPPSEPAKDQTTNEGDKNDKASPPSNPNSGHAPPFVLTTHLKEVLGAANTPAPTPSPASVPPPAAHEDPSTLTFADLPPPCISHSCAWTHKQHWHITSSREVLTTEKQALTSLKRKFAKEASSRVTCVPPPPPPPQPKPDSDDESSDEDEDDNNSPTSQNSGPQASPPATSGPPPSTSPPYPASTPSGAPQTRQPVHPTPLFDPENDPLEAELNAYFEVHGPYAPDPTPTTTPGARVIRPVRSAKSRAAIKRLRGGLWA